ncbi:MAG: phosphate ABC transporter permease subunit PstC [Pseudonocardiales bacterium]|nr:phosphate ABC transporter permease subunit PstC [Pseudonocardiales bacterium]
MTLAGKAQKDVRVPDPRRPQSAPGGGDAAGTGTVAQRGDRIFKALAVGSGVLVVALIGAIGLFLLIQALPPLLHNKANFLTSREFQVSDPNDLRFGILDLLLVTVEASVFALLLAMPTALGIALFLTQYAPPRLSRAFAYLVDLLAAVPSIVYGLWGLLVLAPAIAPLALWLQDNLGFIFLFSKGTADTELGGTIFTAGIVLAVMILPIITAVSREVFSQTPRMQIEGALALGATRWEVITSAVLPFGRSGYVSASMLGLGRALGETIALTIIVAAVGAKAFDGSLFSGGASFASKIALAANEFSNPTLTGAYIAAGLMLFVLTFVVNAAARAIIARSGAQA